MEEQGKVRYGSIIGTVVDQGGSQGPVKGAVIAVYAASAAKQAGKAPKTEPLFRARTAADGSFTIRNVPAGDYVVFCHAFGGCWSEKVEVEGGCMGEVCFHIPLNFTFATFAYTKDCEKLDPCGRGTAGTPMVGKVEHSDAIEDRKLRFEWGFSRATTVQPLTNNNSMVEFLTQFPGQMKIRVAMRGTADGDSDGDDVSASVDTETEIPVSQTTVQPISGTVGVTLGRTSAQPTPDQVLWSAIRNTTDRHSFSGSGFRDFIDRVLCNRDREQPPNATLSRQLAEMGNQIYGVGAYQLLKTATEVFLLLECGVAIRPTGAHDPDPVFDEQLEAARLGQPAALKDLQDRLTQYLGAGQLPYITRVVNTAFPGLPVGHSHCNNVLTAKVNGPCLLELIWSYWHEEGMLVQTVNAITRRFQNVRGPGDRDPLAHLEIDPLRPLNNILWGYIQDEQNRLSVKRRAYEYDHHYGLTLLGKAVNSMRTADSRSKFIEGFHHLLHLCAVFFKEDNDTTIIADGYPLLNALKEVHLTLAQGAHNQFGDLPWTARVEMLMQEWILARPEMRDFLQSRVMVPYKEAWMPQVDTMKTLQGWSDVTVTHYRDLGVYGEQILLSVRYGDWIGINNEDSAKNWARYWRPEIQGYLHGYRAVTGIDLTNPDTVDSTMPGVHLQKRLAMQHRAR